MASILTINMAGNNGDVERRYEDLSEVVLREAPAFMLVQEVSLEVGLPNLEGLATCLGPDYSFHYEGIYRAKNCKEGHAVITSLPVRRSRVAWMPSGGKGVQIIEVGNGDTVWNRAANIHLPAEPKKESVRVRLLREIDDALKADLPTEDHDEVGFIIGGDFNAPPFFPSIRKAQRELGYTSAYKAVHSKHAPTFPTLSVNELVEGRFIESRQSHVLRWLRRVARRGYPLDYVLLKNMPAPTGASLIKSKGDDSAPFSDHAGMVLEGAMAGYSLGV